MVKTRLTNVATPKVEEIGLLEVAEVGELALALTGAIVLVLLGLGDVAFVELETQALETDAQETELLEAEEPDNLAVEVAEVAEVAGEAPAVTVTVPCMPS